MTPSRRRHQTRRRLALQHNPKLLVIAPAATTPRLHDLKPFEGTVLIDIHTRSLLPMRAPRKAVQAGCVRQSEPVWLLTMECEAEGDRIEMTVQLSLEAPDRLVIETSRGARETYRRCTGPVPPEYRSVFED